MFLRDPPALVVDGYGQAVASPPHADQQRALGGVLEAVGEQVLQHGRQQPRIGSRPQAARAQAQFHPGPARRFGVAPDQVAQQLAQVDVLLLGLEPAVVEGVEIEDGAEQLRDVEQRAVDVVHQAPFLVAQAGVAQAGGEQADGVDRLAQVVAGLGQQARFLLVRLQRFLGGLARALQQEVRVEGNDGTGGHQHQHHERLSLPGRGQSIDDQ